MASEIHVSCAGKWQVFLYRMEENICPHILFSPLHPRFRRKIQDWAKSNVANYLSFNTTVSRRSETVCKCRRAIKKTRGKNNPVYSIRLRAADTYLFCGGLCCTR